jgi:Nuclease-related domain
VRTLGENGPGLALAEADRRGPLGRWLLVGLFGVAGLAVLWHAVAWLMASIGMAFTGGRSGAGLTDVGHRRRSERLVAELLAHLPADYVLVNDVALPNRRGVIDHVVIGPCGVVVIEPRQCRDDVADGGTATLVDSHEPDSGGARPGGGAARAIKEFLAERHPDLVRSAVRFVDSVVVFTDPRSPLDIYRSRSVVVRYTELLQFIRELARQRAMDRAVAATLAATLTSVTVSRTVPSRETSVPLTAARHGFSST